MLSNELKHPKSAIGARVRKFGLTVKDSPPFLARTNQLLFLCGANKSANTPSARREAIKKFLEGISPDIRVVYAEGVFNELTKIGSAKNSLDLEHEISDIADNIIIVLESPSAFCELGAFAHQSFRKKLIIINNLEFKKELSFINTGPIAAAEEAKAPVIWYPMANDGVYKTDGVGATFKQLKESIATPTTPRKQRVAEDISDLSPRKTSLYLIHDIVFFAGPLSHKELMEFLATAFGKRSYDSAKHLLGMLRGADLVRSFDAGGTWVYETTTNRPFLQYNSDVNSLMATLRRFHLLTEPSRLGI